MSDSSYRPKFWKKKTPDIKIQMRTKLQSISKWDGRPACAASYSNGLLRLRFQFGKLAQVEWCVCEQSQDFRGFLSALLFTGLHSVKTSRISFMPFYLISYLSKQLHGLWNPEAQCHIHKGSPIIHIPSGINPIPRIDIYRTKSILILTSHLRRGLPKGLFPIGLPVKILKALLPSSFLVTCPAHLNLLDLITLTILVERYKLWSSSLWSLLRCTYPSLLGLLSNWHFENS